MHLHAVSYGVVVVGSMGQHRFRVHRGLQLKLQTSRSPEHAFSFASFESGAPRSPAEAVVSTAVISALPRRRCNQLQRGKLENFDGFGLADPAT